MARSLDVAVKITILQLAGHGWSFRRISRELGVDRTAVSRCVRSADSKPSNPPTGSGITGQTRPPRPRSTVAPYQGIVEEKLKQGLDAKRIHQDLCREHGFAGGYDSVKRFVRRMRRSAPEVYARMEVMPGQEAQVDFGNGAPTLHPVSGRYRRPYFFKMTLSCSRHSYEEVVWRQDLQSFIRCHENAFRFFGGVPEVVRLDNLKAGVTRACFFDPEINKQYMALANHYGFVPLPIRPYTSRHDGKVERGVGYTKRALKGRRFDSLEEQNRFLRDWNRTVARLRIHGTTKQQVWSRFLELEKPALLPLPAEPFAFFNIGTRKVHQDGHIELERTYYSVPHQYVGRQVEVRWDQKLVRILVDDQVVAVHRKSDDQGVFHTRREHLPAHKSYSQEAYQAKLLAKAELLGPGVLAFAQGALETRGLLALRLIQGVLGLCRKHPKERVDWACGRAAASGSYRYRAVTGLLDKALQDVEASEGLLQEHDIIRPLADYSSIVCGRQALS
ncbi:MAG: IS21 family transposase [Thermodesulfobacteriota bacterium]